MSLEAEFVERLVLIAKSLLLGPKEGLLVLGFRMCLKPWMIAKAEFVEILVSIAKSLLQGFEGGLLSLGFRMRF